MRLLFMLMLLPPVFYGCSSAKQYSVVNPAASGEEFIIKTDGTKIIGNVADRKGKIFVDNTGYNYSEIKYFRDLGEYRAIFDGKIYTVWALGRIEAYSSDLAMSGSLVYDYKTNRFRDNSSSVELCYLRKDNGRFLVNTPKTLYQLIKDNDAAVKEFHAHYKKKGNRIPSDVWYTKLRKVLAVYNGKSTVDL